LGIIGKIVPEIQVAFDMSTGIVSTFSVNVGVIYSCFKEYFCFKNSQIPEGVPFITLPNERHIHMFVFGLSCLGIAFMYVLVFSLGNNLNTFVLIIVAQF
jgi:hypothetical protein